MVTFQTMYQLYDYYLRMAENAFTEEEKLSYLKAAKHIERVLADF